MKSSRIIEYDVIRVLAIFCVVLCHATEAIYKFSASGWNSLSNQSRIFMIVSFTFGRLGVPLFLFLTGALILKKDINNDKDVIKFYKNNLLSLVIVNSIWVCIYNIYFLLTDNSQYVTLEMVMKELLFLKQVPLPNMWYMPVIVGIYIGIPFVSKIVKTFSSKSLLLLMSVIFMSSFVLPMVNILLKIFNIDNSFSSLLSLSFLGGTYGLYTLLGYFMTNGKKVKINKFILLLIAVISFILTCIVQIISYSQFSYYNYNVWYNFPLLLVCAMCIFLLFINIDYSKISCRNIKRLNFVSKASLSIFFMHMIVQRFIKEYLILLDLIMSLKVLILFLANIIICIVISFILSRNKFISKYMLLIK